MKTVRKFLLAAAALTAVIGSQAASAALITYNVAFNPIPASPGFSGTGSFTVNSATAVANGNFNSANSPLVNSVTTFSFLVNSNSFTYPNGNFGVQINNGIVSQINYYGATNNAVPTLQLNGLSFVYRIADSPLTQISGSITATLAPAQVPEPSTLALFGLGGLVTAALSAVRRRRTGNAA